ncbi:MAG: dihydroorotate dehydrogenase electron transfer subunit [candidate division WOR-3 bacterium]
MLAAGIFSFWIREPDVARRVRPGQFLNVKVSAGPDPLLRRPISVADVEQNRLRLVFQVKGRGTAVLATANPGSDLDVLGPLGKPAPSFRGRDIFLVGGGVGAAPLLFLCRQSVSSNRVRVFLGARTRRQLILVREFRALDVPIRVATDDGSLGYTGPVTELAELSIKKVSQPVVFACGPRPMLADLVRRVDPVPVWGFVEERMGCGTGICYCCALPKKGGGFMRFCAQGPVVPLNEVEL